MPDIEWWKINTKTVPPKAFATWLAYSAKSKTGE
jgi:hypothetical protein